MPNSLKHYDDARSLIIAVMRRQKWPEKNQKGTAVDLAIRHLATALKTARLRVMPARGDTYAAVSGRQLAAARVLLGLKPMEICIVLQCMPDVIAHAEAEGSMSAVVDIVLRLKSHYEELGVTFIERRGVELAQTEETAPTSPADLLRAALKSLPTPPRQTDARLLDTPSLAAILEGEKLCIEEVRMGRPRR